MPDEPKKLYCPCGNFAVKTTSGKIKWYRPATADKKKTAKTTEDAEAAPAKKGFFD